MSKFKELATEHANRSQFLSDFSHDWHSEYSGFIAGAEHVQKIYEEKSPVTMKDHTIRQTVELNTPAELAIRKAMEEVEKLPASEILTDAVVKLEEARNLVADFVDEQYKPISDLP